MCGFLLWCVLAVLCWPLALLVLLLLPLVFLILLPFKILGAIICGIFSLVIGLVTLPFRILFRF